MGKVRAQLGDVIAARGSSLACCLLLASTTLLAGCNRTSGTGATSSAASATGNVSSAISQPVSSSPAPTAKSADVSWAAPTTNTNGTALTDLAGYRIFYGTSPDKLSQTVNIPNAAATNYVVQGLTQGTWYFAVAAYTNTGLQSGLSSVATKTIT